MPRGIQCTLHCYSVGYTIVMFILDNQECTIIPRGQSAGVSFNNEKTEAQGVSGSQREYETKQDSNSHLLTLVPILTLSPTASNLWFGLLGTKVIFIVTPHLGCTASSLTPTPPHYPLLVSVI